MGGTDVLPAPLDAEREAVVIENLGSQQDKEARDELIEHNLRLVVYIAQRFDNTGVGGGRPHKHWHHRPDQSDQYI